MAITVYSAATAASLQKGKAQEEVWDELTAMFNTEKPGKSLIYGRYPLETQVKKVSADDVAGVGDILKAITIHGTEIFVTVTDWKPTESFSFLEQSYDKNGTQALPPDKTDVELEDHPEGTIIKITRREKGDVSIKGAWDLFERVIVRTNTAEWAAGRLGHILEGNFIDKIKNRESRTVGDYTITRDDSLRIDFEHN